MRIRMQKSREEHHAQVDLGKRLHQRGEAQLAGREARRQAIDLVAVDPLHHEHAPARELRIHERRTHTLLGCEVLPELLDVRSFLPEVHLLAHLHAELAHDVGQRAYVMVREQDVQEEQDAERDVEVDCNKLFDVRAQHLHGDDVLAEHRAVHLSEARRGDGLALEFRKQLVDRSAQLRTR